MRSTVSRPSPMRRALQGLAVATAIGAFFGVIGPFGSFLQPGPLVRILYWIIAMWSGLVLYGAAVRVSARLHPGTAALAWITLVLLALFASIPQAILTRLLAFRLWPDLAEHDLNWASWYGQVATIGVLSVLIWKGVLTFASSRNARPMAAAPSESGSEALRRIAPDVLALQMEDHYVRVHTSAGSQLILKPLSDAIAVMPREGLRTHRSWWVARAAIVRIEGTPRSMALHLSNGLVAPVSRSAVAHLRAAGWLGEP
jgi:LytTr DNA-binding domain